MVTFLSSGKLYRLQLEQFHGKGCSQNIDGRHYAKLVSKVPQNIVYFQSQFIRVTIFSAFKQFSIIKGENMMVPA